MGNPGIRKKNLMTTHNRQIQATTQNDYARGRQCFWRHCFVAAFLVAILAVTADAQTLTFNDPTVTSLDTFGTSVALDGNNVLIGAPGDDTNGTEVGQVHLFDLTGNLLRTFKDPTVTGGTQFFGSSVALDGNNILIGADHDDTTDLNVGQAYLFDALTGNLLQTFDDPTPTDQDNFGFSVALDGNNVLIGAFNDDTLGQDVGQAYLFDALTGNLLRTFNEPTVTGSGGKFGSSVALSGNNVLIGSPLDDTNGFAVGQAHLFDGDPMSPTFGNLLHTFDDPTPTTTDQFGHSVALDGNHVLIGAPGDNTLGHNVGQAHLFDLTGNLLRTFNDPTPNPGNPTTGGGDVFGSSVALDGNNVLIGAPFDDTLGTSVGQAHLFDLTGNLLRTFNDPTPTPGLFVGDLFGTSVALDGNNVLIGARFDSTLGNKVGQAHLFTIPSLLGDFDFDRDVDGEDFLKWQRGESPSPLSQSDLADWEANYGKTISLTDPGDFDVDGDVDGHDFLKWQRGESPDPLSASDLADWEANYGTNNAPIQPGDFDGNGEVNGFDFLHWQRDPSVGSLADWEANYGTVAPLSATSGAVPEPSTWIGLLFAMLAMLFRHNVVVSDRKK